MPTADRHIPKYRHYKPKNLAVVRIDGRDHYLGKFDSAESHEKYHRLVAEWLAGGTTNPPAQEAAGPDRGGLTVNDLILAYFRHCEQYYVKNGEVTNQVRMIRLALKVLRGLYGNSPVQDFGPLALKACRGEFVRQGPLAARMQPPDEPDQAGIPLGDRERGGPGRHLPGPPGRGRVAEGAMRGPGNDAGRACAR